MVTITLEWEIDAFGTEPAITAHTAATTKVRWPT